jgi:hypothetical protein
MKAVLCPAAPDVAVIDLKSPSSRELGVSVGTAIEIVS